MKTIKRKVINKSKSLGLLCAIVMLTPSCATIFTGASQKVTFKSNIDGKVYQNLTEIGKTNDVIKISRLDINKLYTIKKDGCPDKQLVLPIKFNAVFLLNLLNGVFFGGYFDLANGANIKTDKVVDVQVDCNGKK